MAKFNDLYLDDGSGSTSPSLPPKKGGSGSGGSSGGSSGGGNSGGSSGGGYSGGSSNNESRRRELNDKLSYFNDLVYTVKQIIDQLTISNSELNNSINNLVSGCKIDDQIFSQQRLNKNKNEINTMVSTLNNNVLPSLRNKINEINRELNSL